MNILLIAANPVKGTLILLGVLLILAITAFMIALVRGGSCYQEEEAKDVPRDDESYYCDERPFVNELNYN